MNNIDLKKNNYLKIIDQEGMFLKVEIVSLVSFWILQWNDSSTIRNAFNKIRLNMFCCDLKVEITATIKTKMLSFGQFCLY